MKKIFLGGTWAGWDWRKEFETIINGKLLCFNPLTQKWDEKAKKTEIEIRDQTDFNLYVITPELRGAFSVYEACEDSFIRPDKIIFVVITKIENKKMTREMKHSLEEIAARLALRGVECFIDSCYQTCFEYIINFILKQPSKGNIYPIEKKFLWYLFRERRPRKSGKYLIYLPIAGEVEFAHWSMEDQMWFADFGGLEDPQNPIHDDMGYIPCNLRWAEIHTLMAEML